jgi:glycosyltransferase involved in cell wall biosynthesis
VRTHNIEHDYYKSLARVETNIFKKYYFLNEAAKLEAYETILQHATTVAAISKNDANYFNSKYDNAVYIPAFHSNEKVTSIAGRGQFAFYHGNLAIGENNEAAFYLVNQIFKGSHVTLIIAGSKPSVELRSIVQRRHNITLLSDLTTKQIHQLIADAHVNVLPTFQPTGIKLKLLSALFNGKFCLVNTPMVENTGLEQLCTIADTPQDMREQLNRLMKSDFTEIDLALRKEILEEEFSNSKNVEKLLNVMYG